jgi:hypothetical protein
VQNLPIDEATTSTYIPAPPFARLLKIMKGDEMNDGEHDFDSVGI